MLHFVLAVNSIKLHVINCIITNSIMSVHSLAVLVIPERRANQFPVLPPPSSERRLIFNPTVFELSNLQLCSSDSPPLCRCGEEADRTEPPASCCCCLEELDRSMATSSSISSISSSSSSSCSASRASPAPPRRSEASQNESDRVESDSGGLEHFLDISKDFLCIPVRTETETEIQFRLQDSDVSSHELKYK